MRDRKESEVVEGVRDHETVVDSAGYDGKCPGSERNQHGVETNAHCRDMRQEAKGASGTSWEMPRAIGSAGYVEGVKMGGRRGMAQRMATRNESK